MKLLLVIMLLLLTVACGSTGKQDGAPTGVATDVVNKSLAEINSIPNATPRMLPRSKYGNPASYEVFGKRYTVMSSSKGYRKKGIASWYGTKFHGRRTSSGESYDMYAMTAAHKSLPLPTFVKVTNLNNSKSIVVKVNDRGPFHNDRIIDLSYTAAIKLEITDKGTGLVEVVALDPVKFSSAKVSNKIGSIGSVSGKTGTKSQHKHNIYVQIGAFKQHSNAQGVQSRLISFNIRNVKISEARLQQAPVYRVRVGPLVSVKSADEVIDKLADLGFGQPAIVVE